MNLSRRFLPPIGALQALEAVDRLGSATAAANELSLTQSAVSRQLQSLEAQLCVDLFVKQGRRLALTSEAKDYAKDIREALNIIGKSSLQMTINPAGGSLDLAILPSFGMRWLVPRLPEFARLHPEVTINLSTRITEFNFNTEPFDAAIHFGKDGWPDTDALHLKDESVIAVCSPSFIAEKPIQSARDLLNLPLMHIQTRPDAWRDWFAAQGQQVEQVSGMLYDQFSTILQAALHGLGIALIPDYLVEQEIAAGRLIHAWGHATPLPGAYYLVWPKNKEHDVALVKFKDWLSTQVDHEDMLPR
ncbi:Glycine cleavage system transcriptional activator [Roseovarius albus]|uniref:Glycine cleavage system transcriptional activator n=1 Tax=Roseovarius albus TaxID=1247867 RepID=A0A1X6YZL5_9RHOB|nr:LysR family transcriptional regulator [Roseovarius albus]SLN36468.1 Glycine cleavage system transcriptional activator [Roseovarius albus]